jgi:hypothetical protein
MPHFHLHTDEVQKTYMDKGFFERARFRERAATPAGIASLT